MLGWKVRHVGYCGMETFCDEFDELADAKACAAEKLREYRADGFPIEVLESGSKWEIQEPEDCSLVPDNAGYLSILRVAGECKECDNPCDTEHRLCESCFESENSFESDLHSDD